MYLYTLYILVKKYLRGKAWENDGLFDVMTFLKRRENKKVEIFASLLGLIFYYTYPKAKLFQEATFFIIIFTYLK